jgi:hypothetical protein
MIEHIEKSDVSVESSDAIDNNNQTVKTVIFCRPRNKFFYLTSGVVSISISYIVPFVLITFFNSRIVRTLNQRIARRKEYFGKTLKNVNENVNSKKLEKSKFTQSLKGEQNYCLTLGGL